MVINKRPGRLRRFAKSENWLNVKYEQERRGLARTTGIQQPSARSVSS